MENLSSDALEYDPLEEKIVSILDMHVPKNWKEIINDPRKEGIIIAFMLMSLLILVTLIINSHLKRKFSILQQVNCYIFLVMMNLN